MTAGAADRVRLVVCGVVAEAVRGSGAEALLLHDDLSPEGELLHAWLRDALGSDRVWRLTSLASNVHDVASEEERRVIAAWRATRAQRVLSAHPANKTALLLGADPPRADLFPLGDLYASQVEALTGSWSAPEDVAALAYGAGGMAALDDMLIRLVDRRQPAGVTGTVLAAYERGRYFRLRPRLVPKLGPRTIGIDLFD